MSEHRPPVVGRAVCEPVGAPIVKGARSRACRLEGTERGAVAVMFAVLASVLILVAAFAVDLGMQRVSRRDMQALADVAALDLAREMGGRTAAQISADPGWQDAVADILARNNLTLGDSPELAAELGTLDPHTGAFVPAADGTTVPTAVRVRASTSVDYVFTGGSGGAARTAVAALEPSACFKLGSYAASLRSADSPLLTALLNDALDVEVLSYRGLAGAEVTLADLAVELGAGTVDEVLALEELSIGGFYLAVADVLSRQSGQSANVDLLQTLATRVGALPPVRLTDLVALTPGDNSALAARLDVLDLVAGAAFVANGDRFLDVPASASLPWLGASSRLEIKVVQRPQMACGPVGRARAETSQLEIRLNRGRLLDLPPLLGFDVDFDISHLAIELGSAEGVLTEIRCPAAPGDPEGMTVQVGTAMADIGLEANLDVVGWGSSADLHIGLEAHDVSRSGGSVELRYPPMSYDSPAPTPAGPFVIPSVDLRIDGGGGWAAWAGPGPTAALRVQLGGLVVGELNDLLIEPLSTMLGLKTAGADVYGVPHPSCDTPALRG